MSNTIVRPKRWPITSEECAEIITTHGCSDAFWVLQGRWEAKWKELRDLSVRAEYAMDALANARKRTSEGQEITDVMLNTLWGRMELLRLHIARVSDRSGTPQAGNPAEEYGEERGPRNEGDAMKTP